MDTSVRLEELIVLAAVVMLVVLTIHTASRPTRAAAAQVPPSVSPIAWPLEEEVRALRHAQANQAQLQQAVIERLAQQEQQVAAVRADLGAIKQSSFAIQHQVNLLLERGLKGD